MRPPWHLRLEREDEHGNTVMTSVGAGQTPQEAYDEATQFITEAAGKIEPKALPPGRPELAAAE